MPGEDISESLASILSWCSLSSVEVQLRHLANSLSALEDPNHVTQEMVLAVGNYARSLCSAFMDVQLSAESELERVSLIGSRHRSSQEHHHCPAYIEPAHRWLISHLHNPYPSSDYRTHLAAVTKARRKDIDHWFKVARQKIGWTMIREAYFKSRKQMITSATHYFLGLDSGQPMETRIVKEFALMRLKAEEMYDFAPSELALRMDKAVKRQETGHVKEQVIGIDKAGSPPTLGTSVTPRSGLLPSSPSWTAFSPSSSSVTSGGEETVLATDASLEMTQTIGKRRIRDGNEPMTSGSKRIKTLSQEYGKEALTDVDSGPLNATTRKRRLSDSDSQPNPKRRMVQVHQTPLLRAVSDPISSNNFPHNASSTVTSNLVSDSPDTKQGHSHSPLLLSADVIVSPLPAHFSSPVEELRPLDATNDDWSLLTMSLIHQSDWTTDFSHLEANPLSLLPHDSSGSVSRDNSFSLHSVFVADNTRVEPYQQLVPHCKRSSARLGFDSYSPPLCPSLMA